MFELVSTGGWLMVPILLCSVVAMALILERLSALRARRVAPRALFHQAREWAQADDLDTARIQGLAAQAPMGRILAAALLNRHHGREIIKESIEDTGRHVVHELERYLNTLGTIAQIAPLLGLLGTVIGMIKVFSAIVTQGVGDANALAGGISEALLTTAAGLAVAIPTVMFHRYFRGRVDRLVMLMEQDALKLVEILAGDREEDRGIIDTPEELADDIDAKRDAADPVGSVAAVEQAAVPAVLAATAVGEGDRDHEPQAQEPASGGGAGEDHDPGPTGNAHGESDPEPIATSSEDEARASASDEVTTPDAGEQVSEQAGDQFGDERGEEGDDQAAPESEGDQGDESAPLRLDPDGVDINDRGADRVEWEAADSEWADADADSSPEESEAADLGDDDHDGAKTPDETPDETQQVAQAEQQAVADADDPGERR